MNVLEIEHLQKSYPDFTLNDLTLALPSGCIMGLVGENGAGKSTTIKLILNILHKDGGTIRLFGKDHTDSIALAKEDIGVVMDEVGLPECLTIRQIGKVMKHTFKNWDAAAFDRLTERFSLPQDKAFKDFSRGMKMKTGIAVALSHDSKLLLLDEATSGLDPVVRDEVVELLSEFTRDETHSILISSHIVSDLEKLCDYIAFLHKGTLMLCEEKDVLLSEYGMVHGTAEQLATFPPDAIKHKKESPYGIEAIVLRRAVPAGIEIRPVTIEELFVFMVKEAR